jgi:hypothetical protein
MTTRPEFFTFPYWWDSFAEDMGLDPEVALLLQERDEALEDFVNATSQTVSGLSPQNLFVQPTNPNMTSPGMWWETTAVGGDLVTAWVETG